MKYEIESDQDHELIRITVRGELTVESVTELTTAVGAEAAELGFIRFLFDVREATANTDTVDAFFLAANPEKRGLLRGHKRALVYSGDDEIFRFFETVSQNRGYLVEIFTDIDKALAWLIEE